MIQPNLFLPNGDPSADCSEDALANVDTARLMRLVESEFRLCPAGATADEIGLRLGLDELTVRPRVSELKSVHILFATGARRKNRRGNSCAVLIHCDFYKEKI